MTYLDECVKTLDAEEQLMFKEMYEKTISLSKVARKYGYCKSSIQYHKKRIIAKLDILFDGKTW
jgi:DNA-directed RNA polymerase specialized sigma subunit